MEPIGFDIAHTYTIDIGIDEKTMYHFWENDEDEELIAEMNEMVWDIFERIKRHPSIETASLSLNSFPYTMSSSRSWTQIDTVHQIVQVKEVTSEFFDVFKIPFLRGKWFNEAEELALGEHFIISGERGGLFAGKDIMQIEQLKEGGEDVKVTAVAGEVKKNDFEDYVACVYLPLLKNNDITPGFRELCVRVKPAADKDFVENFTRDMLSQLEVGPYYLASVTPISNYRETWLADYQSQINGVYTISLFLIVNIFLCIIGTFWFRVQSRREEIGIRIALGASKRSVFRLFILETLSLLFIASIIAMIISFNINITLLETLENIGLPIIGEMSEKIHGGRFIINYTTVFFCLMIVSFLSVWYPAKRASDIPPVEALRSE